MQVARQQSNLHLVPGQLTIDCVVSQQPVVTTQVLARPNLNGLNQWKLEPVGYLLSQVAERLYIYCRYANMLRVITTVSLLLRNTNSN